MGLVSRLSLANHSDSESFLVVHSLFSQDECQRGFWEWSPFDLSQTLPVDGGLLVPGSLPGPPVLKQLMQMVAMVPARVGGVSALPVTVSLLVGIPLRIKSYGPSCLRGSQALYNDFRCPLFGILALGPCVVVRCWVEPW